MNISPILYILSLTEQIQQSDTTNLTSYTTLNTLITELDKFDVKPYKDFINHTLPGETPWQDRPLASFNIVRYYESYLPSFLLESLFDLKGSKSQQKLGIALRALDKAKLFASNINRSLTELLDHILSEQNISAYYRLDNFTFIPQINKYEYIAYKVVDDFTFDCYHTQLTRDGTGITRSNRYGSHTYYERACAKVIWPEDYI